MDVLPLSPLQEGLLFQSTIAADGPDVYVTQVVVDVEGSVDLGRLRAALAALLRRHPNLRAGFSTTSTGPVQVVPAEAEVPCTAVDAATGQEADLLLDADRAQRFDLASPPLLRCLVVRLPGARARIAVTSHHILMDGWSLPVVLTELFVLYGANGADDALPPAPPFRDYLAWLRTRDRDAAEQAWRAALHGLAEATLVRPSGGRRTTVLPRRHDIELPEPTTAALTGLATTHGLTLNTITQVLWAQLLSGLTGRTDVVFGTTVSGRPSDLPGVTTMVGLLINTLPARVRLVPGETVLELLARVQREQVALLDHQHLGLADVQRAAGTRELFDTAVVLENYPRNALTDTLSAVAGTGLRVTRVDGHDATHYPLGLVVHPGRRLSLSLYHRPDVFDDEAAAALAARIPHLADTIATHPERTLANFPALHPGESHRLLHTLNETAAPKPPRRTAHAGFVEHALRYPSRPAITHGDRTFTYAQVHQHVNELTRVLGKHGVGPETRVAVLQRRSAESVASVPAILQAGGVYVPLHPDWPKARRDLVLAHTGAAVVVTDAACADLLADARVPVIVVPELTESAAATGIEDLSADLPVDPAQLAYVMYTSGSTGVPKGVMCTHEDVAGMLADRSWSGARGATMAHHVPSAFDPSVCELLVPLTTGGHVVVPPTADLDAAGLADLVGRHGVTHCLISPGLLRLLADDDPSCFAGLRELITGGDVVPAATVRRILAEAPDLTIRTHGGATETTVFATHHPMRTPADVPDSVPMGRPRDNVRAYVLDDFLRPVPACVTGELYFGGAGIARGYTSRPALTAERFVADPFGPPGTRLYRTGDLVRQRREGGVDFVGRADDQVKIRGVRVEPGEAEAALASLPGVAQAAVSVRLDRSGDKQLVGYVVADDTGVLDPERLLAGAAAILPGHLVPSAIVTLATFPLTANGKVDRDALPAPGPASAGDRAPGTETERQLCELFGAVLGIAEVHADDDFFRLGGHSLLAMRLIGKARRVLGVELTVQDVFTNPTVAGLAARVTTAPKARPQLRRTRPGGAR
uniref:Long-chain-fatty-acid--CoA ligase n=1 Tax=uncultured bacterium esnapd18 TaxID=1366599 RepID=S5TV47_9BACT|nr:long-chain-fatty-acid--CoA ligase [uncultured bacterium esnapd18]